MLWFRFSHSKYYPFFQNGMIIFSSLLLAIFAIVPLYLNILNLNKNVDENKKEVNQLKQNLQYLSAEPDSVIAQYYNLADITYLQTKDFNSISAALSAAAAESGVSLNSYSIDIGIVAKKSQASDVNSLVMKLTLNGSVSSFTNFLKDLATKAPLFNVQSIDIAGNNINLVVEVAYLPYSESNVDLTTSPISLSNNTITLVQKFSQWDNYGNGTNSVSTSNSTSVAGNLPPF